MDLSTSIVELLKDVESWLKDNNKPTLIDFDLSPSDYVARRHSLSELLKRIATVTEQAAIYPDRRYHLRLRALDAFIRSQAGQRFSFDSLLQLIQNATRSPVSDSEILTTEANLRGALTKHGIEWGSETREQLRTQHGTIAETDLLSCFEATLKAVQAPMEEWLDRSLPLTVTFKLVDVDAYWTYWVSGDSESFSVSINQAKGDLTTAEVVMAVLHELICHGGQLSSWKQRADSGQLDSSFLITSVNSPEQFGLEGLAQTVLWFVDRVAIVGNCVDPFLLEVDMELYHYRELVIQRGLDRIIDGEPVDAAIASIRHFCPWIQEREILRDLRALSSLDLSSYRYVYPVSFRAFVTTAKSKRHEDRRTLVAKLFDDVLYLGDQAEFERWQMV